MHWSPGLSCIDHVTDHVLIMFGVTHWSCASGGNEHRAESEDKIQLRFISEKTMAAHSSTPAWKIPWTEEPDGLQSMGSLRVGHDQVTSLSPFTFMHWRRKWQPTPVFLPGESQGRGSLVGSMGPHRVGHDWSDLAAAVACFICFLEYVFFFFSQYLG